MRRELIDTVAKEIRSLPEKYWEVMALTLEGVSNEDISRNLRIPPPTIRGRVLRARKKLEEKLRRKAIFS